MQRPADLLQRMLAEHPWLVPVIVLACTAAVLAVLAVCTPGSGTAAPLSTTDRGLRVDALHIYPMKGMRGMSVQVAQADGSGFAHDRRFLVVNGAGRFQTQRQLPAMATIVPTLTFQDDAAGAVDGNSVVALTLAQEGRPALRVQVAGGVVGGSGEVGAAPPTAGARVAVHIWGQRVEGAVDQGPAAAAWLCEALGEEGLRLVHMGDGCQRALQSVPGKYAAPIAPQVGPPATTTSFADKYPFLVATTSSLRDLNSWLGPQAAVPMDRFRANIVVAGPAEPWEEDSWTALTVGPLRLQGAKRCVRCRVPTTDQVTGERTRAAPGKKVPEPLATLQQRRTGAKPNEGCFGLNAIHEWTPGAAGRTVRVGDVVIVQAQGVLGPR